MKTKRGLDFFKPSLVTFYLVCLCLNMQAQVTIGSKKLPENYSALEIDSNKGGIRYPQLEQTDIDVLNLSTSDSYGLMLFNKDSETLEFYSANNVWYQLNPNANQDYGINVNISELTSSQAGSALTNTYQLLPTANATVTNVNVGCLLDPYSVFVNASSTTPNITTGESTITITLDYDKIQALSYPSGITLTIQCVANFKINNIAKSITFNVNFDTI